MWYNKKILVKFFEILSIEVKSKDELLAIAIFV